MENLPRPGPSSLFGNSYYIDEYDNSLRDSDIDSFSDRVSDYYRPLEPDDGLESPGTPPGSPGSLSSIPIPRIPNPPQPSTNYDLYDGHFDKIMDDIILRMPLEDRLSVEYLTDLYEDFNKYPDAEGHSQMKVPYLLLEFVACVCFDFTVCGTVFISAFSAPDKADSNSTLFLWQLQTKLINFIALGMISFMFVGPDTYKSINITLEFLSVNAIMYEYSFANSFRYFLINIVAGVVSSLLAIGVYHDLIADIPIEQLLVEIISEFHSMKIGVSYILLALITHFCVATGLTILTTLITSANARKRTVYKVLFSMLIAITIGMPIDPIGHLWPNLILYLMVCLTRLQFPSFDIILFVAYALTLLAIILVYPMIAMQIKFNWRNKYRRYIEYAQ